MDEKIINLENTDILSEICGSYESNIELIEDRLDVKIVCRGSSVLISSDNSKALETAYSVVSYLKKLANLGEIIDEQKVSYAISMYEGGNADDLDRFDRDLVIVTPNGKPIRAKTVGQKKYVDAIKKNTIVLGIGPAGTGKTFLAVAMAVSALKQKQVSRIILTRPAVEAGERLGYLPGDLQSKIDPYLRPLYDSLYETMGTEGYQRNVEKGIIEIAPLAYMRGRTLDDSFIILDEAQNTTPEQMKMFLTRLGFGSKAIVTGDLTQTDLPRSQRSGLAEAVKILDGIDDISVHRLTDKDVVRHKLVQKIILAYEKYDSERKSVSKRYHAKKIKDDK